MSAAALVLDAVVERILHKRAGASPDDLIFMSPESQSHIPVYPCSGTAGSLVAARMCCSLLTVMNSRPLLKVVRKKA